MEKFGTHVFRNTHKDFGVACYDISNNVFAMASFALKSDADSAARLVNDAIKNFTSPNPNKRRLHLSDVVRSTIKKEHDDSRVTVKSFRSSLIHAGRKALNAFSSENPTANTHKKEFERLLEHGEKIFPSDCWNDLKTEVVCHLRLTYGAIPLEWLVPDDEYELPF